jgi:hypothetical protein
LRFYENKTGAEAAALLGIGAAAAHKRTNRALEKLQTFFAKRGVTSTTAAIAGAVSANSMLVAPAGLAKTISGVALAKGATTSISTLTLIKGALKLMAWTKAKTAVVVGVVAVLAVTSTTIVGTKMARKHQPGQQASNPPVLLQSFAADVQSDGTIRCQSTMELLNHSGQPISEDSFGNSDFVHLERITDESGLPLQFTTKHVGNMFQYAVTLNKPVPPGGKLVLTSEETITGLVRATGEPGVCEYQMNHFPGYEGDTRRIETHLLPRGAILLEKHPVDLAETTKDGRIELRIDKVIPPGGSLAIGYRYRLSANTN